jgi:hypothetical protein
VAGIPRADCPIKKLMRAPVFDGRNIYQPDQLQAWASPVSSVDGRLS